MPLTSAQSYALFKAAAWNLLSPLDANHAFNRGLLGGDTGYIEDVYNVYADVIQPAHGDDKNPLAGQALYTQMAALFTNGAAFFAGGLGADIEVQTGWATIANSAVSSNGVAANYTTAAGQAGAGQPITALNGLETTATTDYLHFLKTARTPTNWRIGVNVKPPSIAASVTGLVNSPMPNAAVDEIKFSSPGVANKMDSVIVYLRKPGNVAYGQLQQDVLAAVHGLQIQGCFSAMWNEFAPGVAEAAEPPQNGGSFGMYRTLITYMAYLGFLMLDDKGDDEEATFGDYLDWLLGKYGVPYAQPHVQNPLPNPFPALYQDFFALLYNLWEGVVIGNLADRP